jgi:hypothetical protein
MLEDDLVFVLVGARNHHAPHATLDEIHDTQLMLAQSQTGARS